MKYGPLFNDIYLVAEDPLKLNNSRSTSLISSDILFYS